MQFRKMLQSSKPLQGLAAGIVGALAALLLFFPGWLDRWEAKTWAGRVNMLAAPSTATPKIRLILLDQNSLDWAKDENGLSWPWPREVYSTIVQFCQRTGARSLRSTCFSRSFQVRRGGRSGLRRGVGGYKHVVGSVFLSRTAGSEKSWPAFAPAPISSIRGLGRGWPSPAIGPFPGHPFPCRRYRPPPPSWPTCSTIRISTRSIAGRPCSRSSTAG